MQTENRIGCAIALAISALAPAGVGLASGPAHMPGTLIDSEEIAAPWYGSVYAGDHPGIPESAASRYAVPRPEGDESSARVWVYFTDKGVHDERAYFDAIQELARTYNPRATRRRTLRRTDEGLFDEYDLPLVPEYVRAVVDCGGCVNVGSRWLNGVSVSATVDVIERIGALPFVRAIEPVGGGTVAPPRLERAKPHDGPIQTGGFYGRSEAQIVQINLADLHARGFTGRGVIVGVLDTGFKRSHVAFNHPDHPLDVVAEWDFVNDDPNTDVEAGDPENQHHHGTWILGTIAAYQPGELVGGAYDASFILTKPEDVRSEYGQEEEWFAAALEFIEANGGDVATSSLVAYWYGQDAMDGVTSVMARAINRATANGLHVCQGAGNSGHDNDPGTSHLLTPADAFDVIACGAVDVNSRIAGFSSDGPTRDGRVKPEVLARGVSTWTVSESNDNAFATVSGTSLSTPVVCSAVACLVQAHPEWTVAQMRAHLFKTADYFVANESFDPAYVLGYGIVDADAAASPACGDLNENGDVDLSDFSLFQLCHGGTDQPPAPECPPGVDADCDGDSDVDLDDLRAMYEGFTGPRLPR